MDILKKIEDYLTKLICIQARIGYADVVKLDFWENIYFKHLSIKDKYFSKVNISIETFSWRLIHNQNVICGSSDNYKNAETGLSNLIGKKVVGIETKINDFKIQFEDNFELFAYKSTMEEEDVVFVDIEGDNENYNFVYNGIDWKNYINKGLTKNELLLNNFSKKTTERWITKVPKITNEKFCKDCSYFIEIAGKFYFWDFGICANKDSGFDGKITYIKSTCKYYTKELKKD